MIRLLQRRMKSPVASSSICTRSKALGLNCQSNPSKVFAGGQFLDLHAVEGFGIELPVEPLQGLAVRKASFPDPPRDSAFAARGGLRPQQQVEEVQVRETLLLRLG